MMLINTGTKETFVSDPVILLTILQTLRKIIHVCDNIYQDVTNCFMIYRHGVIAKHHIHWWDDRVTNSGLVVMMSARYPGTESQR